MATAAAMASNRFEVIDPVDALDPDGARQRKSRASEGVDALRAARRAYNELDAANALAEAKRAQDALSEAGPAARFEDLTEAWVLKIASLIANGNQKAAQAETDRLLAVNAAAQFSQDLFPPERIAYAEKVRKKAQAGSAQLEVRTHPAGAEIYVDGAFRGLSPLTVEELASGEHLVMARVPGYGTAQDRSWPGAIDLELRETERAALLRTANEGLGRAEDAVKRDAAARSYAKSVGASEVLLIVLGTTAAAGEVGLKGVRLDAIHGRRHAQNEQTTREDELDARAVSFIESLLAPNELKAAATPQVAAGGRARPSNKRMTGWALLGTGAAALVVGTVFGVRAGARSREFQQMAQTDPSAPEVAASGRTLALMADLSFVVAALAGGAGGYLTFSRDHAPGIPANAGPERAPR
jgi:PEGA domain